MARRPESERVRGREKKNRGGEGLQDAKLQALEKRTRSQGMQAASRDRKGKEIDLPLESLEETLPC